MAVCLSTGFAIFLMINTYLVSLECVASWPVIGWYLPPSNSWSDLIFSHPRSEGWPSNSTLIKDGCGIGQLLCFRCMQIITAGTVILVVTCCFYARCVNRKHFMMASGAGWVLVTEAISCIGRSGSVYLLFLWNKSKGGEHQWNSCHW